MARRDLTAIGDGGRCRADPASTPSGAVGPPPARRPRGPPETVVDLEAHRGGGASGGRAASRRSAEPATGRRGGDAAALAVSRPGAPRPTAVAVAARRNGPGSWRRRRAGRRGGRRAAGRRATTRCSRRATRSRRSPARPWPQARQRRCRRPLHAGGRQLPSYSTTVPAGSVISQQPGVETSLKEGATVHVVPSKGLPSEPVPRCRRPRLRRRHPAAAEAHFGPTVRRSRPTQQRTVPTGQVINWSYNSKLNATVGAPTGRPSSSPSRRARRRSRSHRGRPADLHQAATAPGGRAHVPTQAQAYSTTVPAGQVIGTTPPAGPQRQRARPSPSRSPRARRWSPCPTSAGDTVAEATAALQAQAGLTVGQVYGPARGKVFTTVPLAGQTASKGTRGQPVHPVTDPELRPAGLRPLRGRPDHPVARRGRRLLGGRLRDLRRADGGLEAPRRRARRRTPSTTWWPS